MSYQFNDKLKNLKPFQPTAGEFKFRMNANESHFNLADTFAGRFASVVANLDFNRYPDPNAVKLCETFANRHTLNPKNVVAGNGTDEIIGVIVASFLQKGETLLMLEPDFVLGGVYERLYECKVEKLCKDESFLADPEEVLKKLRETGARLLIFSNPCNPTSVGLSREAVLKIVEGTEALVVVDEAYMDFWNQSILDVACNYDNLIVLKTCSHAVGAAAICLSFAVAEERIIQVLKTVKPPYNVNALTQAVGEVILSEKNLLARAVKEISGSRDEFQKGLAALAEEKTDILCCYHSCTNFILLRLRDAQAVYEALLRKSILVYLFGDCLRITVGNAEENKELLRELRQLLK